ncbi:MAG: nucleotidyltransferase family protein [Clostridia bacterium]|nr:nucleotidyltransferase family protein [Clostridia bacterium]
MTIELRDKLICVIRRGMDLDGVEAVPLSDADCDELIRIGMRQSIQPIIYRGLKTLDVSESVVHTADRERLKETRQYILQDDALNKIGTALDEAGISHIPLKGSVLRDLYPAPGMRTSCDVDVLVRQTDLKRAVAAVEAATDFKALQHNYHDVSMLNGSVYLELHFSIRENMRNIDALLDRVWEYAKPSGDGCRYVLTPEFLLFHNVAHMAYHMVHGGLGIRPFLDLWLLRNKTAYDENTVRKMCADCEIDTFYRKSCALADAWMAGAPTPEGLEVFEQYAQSGGVFGSAESSMASRQREHRGVRYLMHRILMSRELLETEYPVLKEKPYLLPVCQVKRWLRLLKRQKRRQVRREIRTVKSMQAETIDSFDQLLTSLGL